MDGWVGSSSFSFRCRFRNSAFLPASQRITTSSSQATRLRRCPGLEGDVCGSGTSQLPSTISRTCTCGLLRLATSTSSICAFCCFTALAQVCDDKVIFASHGSTSWLSCTAGACLPSAELRQAPCHFGDLLAPRWTSSDHLHEAELQRQARLLQHPVQRP